MPNPGENQAGFQEGAAYAFTQNPKSNPRAVPLSLQDNAASSTAESPGKSSLDSAPATVPIKTIEPPTLEQPKAYHVDLTENVGIGDTIGGAATKTVLKTTPAPETNVIVGYKSGIDAQGNRFQTPIYQNAQQPVKPDVPDPFSSGSTKSLVDTIGSETGIEKAQSTALGNGLIDLSNKQIVAKNQSIGLGNGLIDLANKQIVAKNQSIGLGNALIDVSNQQIKERNALSTAKAESSLKGIVSAGLIGNAKEFDIFNASGAKVGSIPANANSYNSLRTLLDLGEPISIRAVNPQAEQNAKAEAAKSLSDLNSYIGTAKTEGVKSLDILGPSAIGGAFGSQGVKIGTTTPDNALRDVLGYEAKGIPVSLSYQPVEHAVAGPFDSIKTSITSSPVGSFVKGLYGGANIYNEKSPLLTPFTGLSPSVKEGTNSIVPLLSLSGTKSYQPKPADTSFYNSGFLQKNSQYQTGAIIGTLGFGALQLGAPEVGKAPGVIADLLRAGSSKGLVSDIAKAASKGETTIAPQIEKTSANTYRITLGTEGRSITPTQKFQKLIDIFRLPTSKEVPGFGTVATQEGKVVATEVKLPKITQEIGNKQGESAITDIFVQPGKSGITAIIPKDINPDVTETSFLINDLNPVLAERLGAKPVEGLPGYFTGKLTPESRLILKQAEEAGLVTKEKQAFQFPTVDVQKSPTFYVSLAKNPSILGETGTAATEKTLPDITRPDVLAVYRTESKGFESAKGLNVFKGEPYGSKGEDYFLNNYANVNFKPIINPETGRLESIRGFGEEANAERTIPRNKKSTPFSFKTLGKSSIGAGASGKAKSLFNEGKTENIFKDFFKTYQSPRELNPFGTGQQYFGVGKYPISFGMGVGSYFNVNPSGTGGVGNYNTSNGFIYSTSQKSNPEYEKLKKQIEDNKKRLLEEKDPNRRKVLEKDIARKQNRLSNINPNLSSNALIKYEKQPNLGTGKYEPGLVIKTPLESERKNRFKLETEILSFPPGTRSELAGKQIGTQGIKLSNDILQSAQEKQAKAQRGSTLYKLSSELKQRQNQREGLLSISRLTQGQKTNLDRLLRFDVGSIQSTRTGQTQKTGLSQITSLAQLTRTTPVQTERTGLLQQGQELLTTPLLTQHLLIPGPLTIPNPLKTPPKVPGGGGGWNFNFTFGGEGGPKQKKVRFKKSFVAYSVNPNIVGAIEQAGLPGLQTSSTSAVFRNVDKQLAKATRLQYKGSKLRF